MSFTRKSSHLKRWTLFLGTAMLLSVAVSVAQTRKDLRYTVTAGTTLFIINHTGSINVHPSQSRQLQVTATQASDKVEIDGTQTGNRITVRTHVLQKAAGDVSRVDYDIALPADAGINI